MPPFYPSEMYSRVVQEGPLQTTAIHFCSFCLTKDSFYPGALEKVQLWWPLPRASEVACSVKKRKGVLTTDCC